MTAIYAIVGPTAVGKSDVALDLAELLGAEIVSADSRCPRPSAVASPTT
jgi:tRNA A37 N6-isopentenylltransferase MiaA